MDEETLNLAFEELQQSVGEWLGYGRGLAGGGRAWTTAQDKAIKAFLKEGQSDFYFSGYPWSFNKPVTSLTLAAGENTVKLPQDFGGVEGQVYYSASGGSGWSPIDFGNVGKVYQAEMLYPTMTGPPKLACIEAERGVGATRGSRMRMRAFPLADVAYTVKFQFYLNPLAVSGERPYGYGGVQHAHTILQACKAAAERGNGIGENGPEQSKFRDRLRASMQMDGRNGTQNWGYNTDHSRERDGWGGRRNPLQGTIVTINGITPE